MSDFNAGQPAVASLNRAHSGGGGGKIFIDLKGKGQKGVLSLLSPGDLLSGRYFFFLFFLLGQICAI